MYSTRTMNSTLQPHYLVNTGKLTRLFVHVYRRQCRDETHRIQCVNTLGLLSPPNRPGHYILQLWFLSSLFPSPILSGRRWDNYHTSTCGLSAILECRCEMCGTRLAEIQDAKIRQKFAICAPSLNFVGL